ncbi:AMP-binding protein, partial [bacterium]|nr:AMP-binding protein [bacterium]
MESRVWHRAYDDAVPAGLTLEDRTLPEFLRDSARRFPDTIAIRFMNGTLRYSELDTQVDRFAAALIRFGVEHGDRVAIQLPNLPQAVIAFFGTLRAGAVAVMTNPLYTPREILHQWNDADCKVAVTTDFLFADRIEGIRAELPVREYLVASIPEYLRFPLNLLAPLKLRRAHLMADIPDEPTIHRFRELVAHDVPAADPGSARDRQDALAAAVRDPGS